MEIERVRKDLAEGGSDDGHAFRVSACRLGRRMLRDLEELLANDPETDANNQKLREEMHGQGAPAAFRHGYHVTLQSSTTWT